MRNRQTLGRRQARGSSKIPSAATCSAFIVPDFVLRDNFEAVRSRSMIVLSRYCCGTTIQCSAMRSLRKPSAPCATRSRSLVIGTVSMPEPDRTSRNSALRRVTATLVSLTTTSTFTVGVFKVPTRSTIFGSVSICNRVVTIFAAAAELLRARSGVRRHRRSALFRHSSAGSPARTATRRRSHLPLGHTWSGLEVTSTRRIDRQAAHNEKN